MPLENVTYQDSPFDPDNHAAYEAWRTHKLEDYPQHAEELIVEVNDPRDLSNTEREAILVRCAKTNMAVYKSNTGTDPDKLARARSSRRHAGLIHLVSWKAIYCAGFLPVILLNAR